MLSLQRLVWPEEFFKVVEKALRSEERYRVG